jgi:hypothetical protein
MSDRPCSQIIFTECDGTSCAGALLATDGAGNSLANCADANCSALCDGI